jgi:alanine racemase
VARPIRATISGEALRHNYGAAKRIAARSKVIAVVKADGYGHGLARVSKALKDADGFGLIEPEYAVRLRESGLSQEILLLEGFFEASELPALAAANIATAVHSEEQLRHLEAFKGGKLDTYFKINTGMNRLGFAPKAARAALTRLQACASVKSVTLMTHFATADGPEGIDEAMRRFNEATAGIALPRSVANSAAIIAHPHTHADKVRECIALYGATPFSDRSAQSLGLKPAMTLTSELIAVQELAPGETIGYGATYRAGEAMRIGVVACGYADGYPRLAPSGTPIVVGGVRTKTAGRVSMDMITVDLTPVPQARVGTPVVLWGEGMPVDEVAAAAGTVGYELMCALAPRVAVEAQP